MLDELFSLLKPEAGIRHMNVLLMCVQDILQNTDQYYLIDKEHRNHAIDLVIELIKSQKEKT